FQGQKNVVNGRDRHHGLGKTTDANVPWIPKGNQKSRFGNNTADRRNKGSQGWIFINQEPLAERLAKKTFGASKIIRTQLSQPVDGSGIQSGKDSFRRKVERQRKINLLIKNRCFLDRNDFRMRVQDLFQ